MKILTLLASVLMTTATSVSAQWTIIRQDSTEEFRAAHFLNRDTGFVAGSYNGSIYRTTNGGTNWTVYNNPTFNTDNFNDFSFPSATIGYAAGANFSFSPKQVGMKTTDGGLSWDTLHFSDTTPYLNFGKVDFADNNNGIFVTSDVYVTSNAAASFTLLPKPITSGGDTLHYIYFANAEMRAVQNVVASFVWSASIDAPPSSTRTGIFITTDGGQSWLEKYRDSLAIEHLTFSDNNHGWAVTGSHLLHTLDGGNTWTKSALPPLGNGGFVTNLNFSRATTGWISTNQYSGSSQSGQLYYTNDGGATWTLNLSIPDRMITSFDISASGIGYLTTPNRIYKTLNGGSATAINKNKLDDDALFLYPNPATDVINIRWTNSNLSLEQIVISDIKGRQLKRLEASKTIAVADLAPGVYTMEIYTNMGMSNRKFIIE